MVSIRLLVEVEVAHEVLHWLLHALAHGSSLHRWDWLLHLMVHGGLTHHRHIHFFTSVAKEDIAAPCHRAWLGALVGKCWFVAVVVVGGRRPGALAHSVGLFCGVGGCCFPLCFALSHLIGGRDSGRCRFCCCAMRAHRARMTSSNSNCRAF